MRYAVAGLVSFVSLVFGLSVAAGDFRDGLAGAVWVVFFVACVVGLVLLWMWAI